MAKKGVVLGQWERNDYEYYKSRGVASELSPNAMTVIALRSDAVLIEKRQNGSWKGGWTILRRKISASASEVGEKLAAKGFVSSK